MAVRALQRNKQPFGQYWHLCPICFQNTLKKFKIKRCSCWIRSGLTPQSSLYHWFLSSRVSRVHTSGFNGGGRPGDEGQSTKPNHFAPIFSQIQLLIWGVGAGESELPRGSCSHLLPSPQQAALAAYTLCGGPWSILASGTPKAQQICRSSSFWTCSAAPGSPH